MIAADLKFYVGLTPPYPDWIPCDEHIMLSAASLWWPCRGKFVRRRFPQCREVFLDCGGFVAHTLYGGYPWTVDEYLALVFARKPHYVATMDYPCEPDLHRGDLRTNKMRIDMTVDNAEHLMGWCDTGLTWVPVIQGYTLDEYRYCIDQYRKRGLLRSVMAVGSMCRRWSSIEHLQETIAAVRDAVDEVSRDHIRLHWFGLHLWGVRFLSPGDSWDSTAWTMEANGGKRFAPRADYHRLYVDYKERIKRNVRNSQ